MSASKPTDTAESALLPENSYALDQLDRTDFIASIHQGLKDLEEGKGISLENLEAELNARYRQ